MLERTTGFILAAATPARLGLAVLALVIFSALLFGPLSPWAAVSAAAGGMLPEGRPGVDAVRVLDAVDRMAPDGRLGYLAVQALDVPFFIAQSAVLALLLALALLATGRERTALRWLLVLPVVLVVVEVLEDLALVVITLAHPARPEALATVAGVLTTTKLGLAFLLLPLALLSLLIWLGVVIARRLR